MPSVNRTSEELWDEWAALPDGGEETDSSELSGLTTSLPFKKNQQKDNLTVCLAASRPMALRRLVKLWKNSRWKLDWNAASAISVPAGMKGRAELSMPLPLYETVTGYAAPDRWAWLRGVWGGGGSLYVPKAGYYLVVRLWSEPAASRAAQIMRKAGIPLRERRAGKFELVVRDQQGIVAFLSKIGLPGVSLRMEDKAIVRSMRDQANRLRNCDTANINKTLKAAEEQTGMAAEILEEGLLETLPQNLRVIVEARLEHPEESLSELGRRLSPPVTKSTVKYRWNRLQKFINEKMSK